MGSLRIGPISLGERSKVAEQRENVESGWGLPSGANYPSAEKAESTGKQLKLQRDCLGGQEQWFCMNVAGETDLPGDLDCQLAKSIDGDYS